MGTMLVDPSQFLVAAMTHCPDGLMSYAPDGVMPEGAPSIMFWVNPFHAPEPSRAHISAAPSHPRISEMSPQIQLRLSTASSSHVPRGLGTPPRFHCPRLSAEGPTGREAQLPPTWSVPRVIRPWKSAGRDTKTVCCAAIQRYLRGM